MLRKLAALIGSDLPTDGYRGQRTWLLRSCGLFLVLLMSGTWKLWFADGLYPNVPLLAWGQSIPTWLDQLFAGLLMVSGLGLCFANFRTKLNTTSTEREVATTEWLSNPRGLRACTLAAITVATLLVMSNQHRFQPWLYQILLVTVTCVFCSARSAAVMLRLLFISIYLYSAVSKFDHQFLHTLGQQLLQTLLAFAGQSMDSVPDNLRIPLAATFPLGELLIALGLLLPRTRRLAAGFAIVLHVILIAVLGPWGLQHQWGVLLWNGFFIVQVCLLFFYRSTSQPAGTSHTPLAVRSDKLVQLVVCLAIAWPLLEPVGLIDHWPAWQLYAPRNSRVRMEILEETAQNLPTRFKPYLRPSDTGRPWVRLDLNAWSLDSLSAPIYPQDRFQVGVALRVVQQAELGDKFRLTQQSTSHRLTGERHQTIVRSQAELEKLAEGFFLHAKPSD